MPTAARACAQSATTAGSSTGAAQHRGCAAPGLSGDAPATTAASARPGRACTPGRCPRCCPRTPPPWPASPAGPSTGAGLFQVVAFNAAPLPARPAGTLRCLARSGRSLGPHGVGVGWPRDGLIRAHEQHEAAVQNHQPPVVVLEDGHLRSRPGSLWRHRSRPCSAVGAGAAAGQAPCGAAQRFAGGTEGGRARI